MGFELRPGGAKRGRAQIEMRLHRLGRIHVDVLHEPARLVSADRHSARSIATQPLAISREMGPVAGIGGK